MLEVKGLTGGYGRIEVLHGVDAHIAVGEIVTLIGANGAGKTTLMRIISGVQPLIAGKITFEGADFTTLAPHKRVAAGIIQVPPDERGGQPASRRLPPQAHARCRP